jgi:hypothetical protein
MAQLDERRLRAENPRILHRAREKEMGMLRTASLCYSVFVLSWGFNEQVGMIKHNLRARLHIDARDIWTIL